MGMDSITLNPGLLPETIAVLLTEYFFIYGDAQYFLLKGLYSSLKAADESVAGRNAHAILSRIEMPPSDSVLHTQFAGSGERADGCVAGSLPWQDPDNHRRIFSKAWVAILKVDLPIKLQKNILYALPDKVMPHLTNPLVLGEYLTQAWEVGG